MVDGIADRNQKLGDSMEVQSMNGESNEAARKSIFTGVRQYLERIDIEAAISQIELNWSKKASRSKSNWCLRMVPLKGDSGYVTKSDWANSEVLLERTIADQCRQQQMHVWNQMPVASGLLAKEFAAEGRRAIDLVYQPTGHERVFEFIELKVRRNKGLTDTLRHAAFDLLEYGLLYLFSRKHLKDLGYGKSTDNNSYEVLHANEIRLRVLARSDYYENQDHESVFVELFNAALAVYIQRNCEVFGNLTLNLGFQVLGDKTEAGIAFLNKQDWLDQESQQ